MTMNDNREGGEEAPPPSPTGRPWPVLDGKAFHGLPGQIIATVLPHTEADPAAMLFTLYGAAGAMIGRQPHILTGGVHHGARVWPLIIGRTAGGMKGTSWAEVRRVLKHADVTFHQDRVVSGLSSAEGLIIQVRDPSGDPESDSYDEGVEDKRLLIIESEFASVLAQGKREGNTLLPLIRQAWDGGTLRTMTVKPKIATDPHIGMIGHITPTELRMKLNEAERAGGTMNRFLPVLSKRSKLLPDGGDLSEVEVKGLGAELGGVIAKARTIGQMKRSMAAAERWRLLYERLAADHAGDGPVAQVVARAAPQVLRLSVMAALLDGCDYVDLPHLEAAEAMWDYAEDSAWYVFGGGSGNPDLDRLKTFVDESGEAGVTRTEISTKCFSRNKEASEIDGLLVELLKITGYTEFTTPTKGRPRTVYRRTKTN